MKVFISWSGERSQYIAAALRDWLPNVIQSLDPWMSDKDIAGGSRWLLALAGQLNEAMTGILCVTPENQSNPWLVFEAGALSKTIGQTMVCPLLFDLEPTQMTGPLTQFQAKVLDRASVLSILNTLNASMTAGKLTLDRLERAFDRCWPELETKLTNVPPSDAAHKPKRQSEDMLEEILTIVRDQQRREEARTLVARSLVPSAKEPDFGRQGTNIRMRRPQYVRGMNMQSMSDFVKNFRASSGPDAAAIAAALPQYDPVEIQRVLESLDASVFTGDAIDVERALADAASAADPKSVSE